MKTDTLKSSELNVCNRFDSSYHLSDSVTFEKRIKERKYLPLSELVTEIFTAGRSKRIYVKNSELGYPYLSNSDITAQSPLSNCNYVSKKYSYDKKSFLKERMIVTGRVGAIGQTAYISKYFEDNNAMGSDNIIRIVPKDTTLAGYLYAFLDSKYGNTFFWKISSGGVQPYISESALYDFPIPIISSQKQQEIHNLIVEASVLRADANNITSNLLNRINTLLSIQYSEIKKQTVSSSHIKKLKESEKRFDAPYNSGVGRIIYDRIVSHEHKTLADVSEVFHPMLFGKKQLKGTVNKGNALYKSSSMMKIKPETDFWLSLRKIDSYSKLQVKEGWVLISRTGTVGNVVWIGSSMNNVFIDDHMIRVNPKKEYSGLIFIYLKSFFGQKLIEFQKYGSVQEVINNNYIERIPIPISLFEDNILTELNDGVSEAYEKIDMAIYYEAKAINLIETEIDSWQN